MDAYDCALYCLACACVSLPLHDGCLLRSTFFSARDCERLRLGLLVVVFALSTSNLARARTREHAVALSIPTVLCVALVLAKAPKRAALRA